MYQVLMKHTQQLPQDETVYGPETWEVSTVYFMRSSTWLTLGRCCKVEYILKSLGQPLKKKKGKEIQLKIGKIKF